MAKTPHYKSLFISDVHLGFKYSQAKPLLDFLKSMEFENLYAVGDIIDLWSLKRTIYFPAEHFKVVKHIQKRAKNGVNTIYIPGNHDEYIRDHIEKIEDDDDEFNIFGHIKIQHSADHITANKRRFKVAHGDEYDSVMKFNPWLAKLGSIGYEILLRLNKPINSILNYTGINPEFSLSKYAKKTVKDAASYIGGFEELVIEDLRNRSEELQKKKKSSYSGIICGHIHHPNIRRMEDLLYLNCGDWVESKTGLVETDDGTFAILDHRGKVLLREE